MAYAKLVFPSGTFVLRKLKEIARFATGQITTNANLEFADQNLTEISIIDPPGWTLQSQTFEASGTATATGYRLTAPCVNGSKNKCVYMDTYVEDSFLSLTTAWTYTTRPASTATAGNVILRLGSSWSGTTLNNITSRPNGFYGYHNSGIPGNTVEKAYFLAPALDANEIYVFCSARKIILVTPETSGMSQITSILEFPETSHTMQHNNIPALASSARYLSSVAPNEFTVTADPTMTLAGNGVTHYYYQVQQLVNWYNPALGTRANRGLQDYGTDNLKAMSIPSLNITSGGQTAYPLVPITDIRVVYGEGIHDYSKLTDMYVTFRESSYIGQGDTIDVSGVKYAIVQVGESASNYRALAIKKG